VPVGRGANDQVLRMLAEEPPGRLLDLPAGDGPVRSAAEQLGYRVVEADLFPRAGFRGVRADACAPLPFRSASFDVVLSMEGIEHFEDQAGFVRECARVLRPGGRLLLTTPNVLHLNARVAAFLVGQRLLGQGFVNEESTVRARDDGRVYHGHAFLIDAFRLRYLLRIAGFRLERVAATRLSASSIALAPLVPALAMAARVALRRGRRRQSRRGRPAPTPAVEREIAALATSRALLFGKGLVVAARREATAP
jgi:SAM-dependent methyltransferase